MSTSAGKSPISVVRGQAPIVVSVPHCGTQIPNDIEVRLASSWIARKDTDWWVDQLYAFVCEMGATLVKTSISRSVIDVNRDPDGASLYPGMNTTGLCPATTFDGEALYHDERVPDAGEVAERRTRFFDPYHAALASEIARLRAVHAVVVVYDAHSIRSRVPRLFAGELPVFNIGTNDGRSCATALTQRVESVCAQSGRSHVVDGRFKGGFITRYYGRPADGVHAIQVELACRAYLHEPPVDRLTEAGWPVAYDAEFATGIQATLKQVIDTCLAFARAP